jgi:putative oxidoreductase
MRLSLVCGGLPWRAAASMPARSGRFRTVLPASGGANKTNGFQPRNLRRDRQFNWRSQGFRRPLSDQQGKPPMFDRLSAYSPQALAVLRIMTGLLFLEHGTQKMFNFPPPTTPAPAGMDTIMLVTSVFEVVGGLLIVVGFLTRPVAFILSGMMAVAYFMAHAPQNFFPVNNMGDAAILFCFIFLYLFFAGPGAWSIDTSRE